jgi:tRNA(His) 5'-end guanylyltransferase
MIQDSLGDRMKEYENCSRITLPRGIPKIIRVDGKAFHTLLANAQRPYDISVMGAMIEGAKRVIAEIGGICRMCYIQSDEASFLINDFLTIQTQPWFANNIQKMVSVTASMFTCGFNDAYLRYDEYNVKLGSCGYFDARVFTIPNHDINNYFVWRQKDATRNSINMYAQSMFSHNELQGLSCEQMQEKMFTEKQYNWDTSPTWTKRGLVVTRDGVDKEMPLLTADRSYVETKYNSVPI